MLPVLAPIVPGARQLSRSSGDLLWLLADADAQGLSGQYIDGRVVQPGSSESSDPAKIARAIEVAHELLGRHLNPTSPFLASRFTR
jgi:hypothetical protein